MENIKIKLTRDKYNFRFKQYEGTYFHGEVKDENIVKYKKHIFVINFYKIVIFI